MLDTLSNLAQTFEELRGCAKLAVNVKDAGLDEAIHSDLNTNGELFRQMFGFECPETLKLGLVLPDMLSVDWRFNDKVAGEFALSNHFLSINRTVDESLQDLVLDGIKLADTHIIDSVVLHGGPIHLLALVSPTGLSEQLYVFNMREIYELELSYNDYLQRLSLTKGITYWQYLFCRKMRPSGFESAVLREEIAFLQAAFPGYDYQPLQIKRTEKCR